MVHFSCVMAKLLTASVQTLLLSLTKTSHLSVASNGNWFCVYRFYSVFITTLVNKCLLLFAAHADRPSQVGLPQRPVGSSSRGWRTGTHGAHRRSSASHTRSDPTADSLLCYRLFYKFAVTLPACVGLTFAFSLKHSLLFCLVSYWFSFVLLYFPPGPVNPPSAPFISPPTPHSSFLSPPAHLGKCTIKRKIWAPLESKSTDI